MQPHEFEVPMLEQQPARSVLEDITPADPGYAQLAGLVRQRAQQIELRLNVENGNYSLYQASLQNIDRKPIGPQQRIKPFRRGQNKVIPFKVAARLLPPGSYYVHVDGLTPSGEAEDFNDYPFRVTSR